MPPLRLLFVCSMNRWRSPTAERVYARDPRAAVRSGGVSKGAARRVQAGDLAWADAVIAMEEEHLTRLRRAFPREMAEPGLEAFALDVPDEFRLMDPALVEEVRAAVDPWLEERLAERDSIRGPSAFLPLSVGGPRICEAAPMPHAVPPRRRLFRPWSLLILLAVLVPAIGIVGLVAAGTLEQKLLYPCASRPAPEAMAWTRNTRRLWVEHAGGRTPADFTPGVGRSAADPGPLVVYLHGNGELIEDWAITEQRPGRLASYVDRGVSILVVEYRGAGSSTGETTKAGITADAVALRDLGVEQPEVDAQRVILHGRSMGGGIVSALALERPPAGLILESTYTSILALTRSMGIPSTLVRDRWDVLGTVRGFAGPVFIGHGREDGAIPFAMAEENAAAAADGRLVARDGGHNDAWPDALFGEALGFVLP